MKMRWFFRQGKPRAERTAHIGCGHALLSSLLLAALLLLPLLVSASPLIPLTAERVEVPAPDAPVSPDTSFYARYPYVLLIDGDADADVSDEDFYRYAASIVFNVSKWDLPADDRTLRQLADTVLPRISRDSLRIVRVKMRGAASPEGPVSFNRFLSQKRQRALYDFVSEYMRLPQGDSLLLETETEDYHYLYKRMQQDGDPDSERVKQLFDRYMPHRQYAELKRQLQRIDGGRLWRRMLVSYFPSLRAARMVIVCQRKPIGPVSPISPVSPADSIRPIGPISPISPADSIGPISPISPVSPIGPVGPIPPSRDTVRLHRRELLSVKTNLLFWGVYMPFGYNRWCPIPNISVEYYPKRGHFTYGASFDCPWWQSYHRHKFFQVRNYQVEARYYFRSGSIDKNPPGRGAAFRRLYLQAYAQALCFGICFDAERGWEGEGFGGGIGVGYVLPLTRRGHWRLEFQVQAGVIAGKHDPYQYEYIDVPGWKDYPHDDLYYYKYYGDPDQFQRRQHRFTWFGPTRIGVTLSYDLLYRRIQKKRASFRPWENAIRILGAEPSDGGKGGAQQ